MGKRIFLVVVIAVLMVLAMSVNVWAQDDAGYALAEFGPYGVGWTTLSFVDDARDGRDVVVEVWYPAVIPDGEAYIPGGLQDAQPDAADGPYPLVLMSVGHQLPPVECRNPLWGDGCAQLASHGFVVAVPTHNDSEVMWTTAAHRPMDMLFTLNQITAMPTDELRDIIDTDTVGVSGTSLGGYTAIALTGVWVDVRPLQEQAEIVEHAGLGIDAPWPAFTDERIKAVVSIVPTGSPVFTVEALNAATVPTLIIAAASDTWADYGPNAAYMYTFLGSEELYMLSIIGADHLDLWVPELHPAIPHFQAAYLGYHLQGKEEYTQYLTEDFIAPHEDLVWGVYPAQ